MTMLCSAYKYKFLLPLLIVIRGMRDGGGEASERSREAWQVPSDGQRFRDLHEKSIEIQLAGSAAGVR